VVGRVNASKFGTAISNFGSADPPSSVPTFSHATDYLTKLCLRSPVPALVSLSNAATYACGVSTLGSTLTLEHRERRPNTFLNHNILRYRKFPPVDQRFPMLTGLWIPETWAMRVRYPFLRCQGSGYGFDPGRNMAIFVWNSAVV